MKLTFLFFILFFCFCNDCNAVIAETKPSIPINVPQKKSIEPTSIFTDKTFLARMAVELIASFVLIASLLFIPNNIYSYTTVVLTLIGAIFLLGYSFYEIAKIFKGKDFRSIPSFLVHLLIALIGIFTFKKYK